MPTSLKERFEKKKSKTKKKHLVRRLNEVAKQVTEMKKQCSSCQLSFDPSVPGALDSWSVTVTPEGARLTCPSCNRPQSDSAGVAEIEVDR